MSIERRLHLTYIHETNAIILACQTKLIHCHELLTAAFALHLGTAYARFGSLSHVTVPPLDTFTNLYPTPDPGAIGRVIVQTGLADV
jgi:hypothetical protein